MPRRPKTSQSEPADVAAQLLLCHGASAMCVYDAQDRITRWNARYPEFFPEVAPLLKVGLHFVETVRPFLRLQHPDASAQEIEAGAAAALRRHRALEGPVRYQRADGGRWLELRMFPQPDGGRIKIWNDVTAQQQAAAAAGDRGMLELLTVAHVGLIVHDVEGRLLYSNARYFSEMFLHVLTSLPDMRVRGPHAAFWPEFREIFGGEPAYEALCSLPGGGRLPQPVTLKARTGHWFRIAEEDWRGGVASIWTDVTDLMQRGQALQAAYGEVMALNAQLRDRAETDSLTGLPNRRHFEAALARAQRLVDEGAGHAVAVVDIDRFKSINDRFGHDVGDHILTEVGRCMRATLQPGDLLARFGGDEFAAVLQVAGLEEAAARARSLCAVVERLCLQTTAEHAIRTSVSVGVAALHAQGDPAETMREADLAMFEAKKAGRNRVGVGR
ncbi:sensor domain-containing diguanylate cyclase [uncultured Pseudacidovorax sp.]|uniref:GGDEF domain-containing protein n=1 Tax=uncultured Pseudacidovorax sp. TaxID=679313 RepID=UPI0025F07A8C|nr:sensor domain-containing diguanylate cyclase [uncultured Pseudacidovorax sp.]